MYIPEKGILPNSNIYFNTPNNLVQSMFFYVFSAGDFSCDENYYVKRENFNRYLIIYIKKGEGFIEFRGREYAAKEGDVVLIDCCQPHVYYTKSGWEIQWVHFAGNISSQLFELIYDRVGCVISQGNTKIIQKYIIIIIESLKESKQIPESIISCHIHRMLSELLVISSNSFVKNQEKYNPVADAITYIETNYKKKLTLSGLAGWLGISPFHFSRMFKKETGYAPYEYIMKTRMNHAKILLKQTEYCIREIADETGFSSESSFINYFRSSVGITPGQFRKTPL